MTSRTSDSSEWANLSTAVLQATGADRSCGGSSNRTDPGCAASGRRGQTLSAAVLQATGADRPCPRLCKATGATDPVCGSAASDRRGQTLSTPLLQATGADRLCPRLWFRRLARTDSVRGCAPSNMREQTLQATGADRLCPRLCSKRCCKRQARTDPVRGCAQRPARTDSVRGCAPSGAASVCRRGQTLSTAVLSDRRGQTLSAAVLQATCADGPCPQLCSISDRCGQTLSAAVLSATGSNRQACPQLCPISDIGADRACPRLCSKRPVRTDRPWLCSGQTLSAAVLRRQARTAMVWPPFAPSDTWAAPGACVSSECEGGHIAAIQLHGQWTLTIIIKLRVVPLALNSATRRRPCMRDLKRKFCCSVKVERAVVYNKKYHM